MVGQGKIRRKAAAVVAAVIAAGLLASAPSALAWEWVSGPPRTEPVPWTLGELPSDKSAHTVTIRLLGGFCIGEPHPLAGPVTIVERPVSAAQPRPSVVITADQISPEPSEVKGEVLPGEPVPACAGIGFSMTKRIKLKRPVRDLAFFDGSKDPPMRVKPLARR